MFNTRINTKQALRAGAGVLAMMGFAASLMAGSPTQTAQPVMVTNPVTVANPVTTVTVSNGQMAVTNGALNPVPTTDNSGLHAVEVAFSCTFGAGTNTTNCAQSYLPPVNKRLVIEDVSFGGYVPSGQKVRVDLQVYFNGGPSYAYFSTESIDTGIQALFSGGRATKIYADPTGNVQALGYRSSTIGAGLLDIRVRGHLVDLQ